MVDSSLADAAHAYARLGWPVFPLVTDGKAPLTAHGHLDASTSGADIQAWWEQWPQANIGIPCGIDTFDCLDVDNKRKTPTGHVADMRAMNYLPEVAKAGWLRGAWRTVQTPSGGLHFYFQGTTGQRPGKTCNGPDGVPWPFDFRTTGGYVAVPPSVVNGDTYRIHEDLGIIAARPFNWEAFKAWLWTPPPPQPRPGSSWQPVEGYVTPAAQIEDWVKTRPPHIPDRHQSLLNSALRIWTDKTHGDWSEFRLAAYNVYRDDPGRPSPGEIERMITDTERKYA